VVYIYSALAAMYTAPKYSAAVGDALRPLPKQGLAMPGTAEDHNFA
jgi:hypothetical protein